MGFFVCKIWQRFFFDYNFCAFLNLLVFFMSEITDEQQLKINKLMKLKYKRHRRMMIWTWFFIVLYSVWVFFLLLHFHNVEYYLNWGVVFWLFITFGIYLLSVSVWTAWNDIFWKWVDKIMISVGLIIVVIAVIFCSVVWFFGSDLAPIQYVFLIFVVFVILYLFLCFFDKKPVKVESLLFIYLIFYFVFLCPVLFQAISNLWIFWKLCNFIFWVSPLFLVLLRTYLVDFVGSGFFIRKFFLEKDSEIWNCPQCHRHITKKPLQFCPHCWNERYCGKILKNNIYCESCGFSFKIRDFDFPNYCPHCGLSFRRRKARK